MKITISAKFDVEPCDPDSFRNPGIEAIKRAVAQAIQNAISHGQGEGHIHDLSDEISILLDGNVKVTKVEDKPDIPIGTGVTYGIGGDCYPYTVIAQPNPKTLIIQSDDTTWVEENGKKVCKYTPNPNAATREITLRNNGRWVLKGDSMNSGGFYTIGHRRYYQSPEV